MKFFLAHPPTGTFVREDRCQSHVEGTLFGAVRPPMELATMAAVLREGGERIALRDFPVEGLSAAEAVRSIRDYSPDWIIFGLTAPSLADDLASSARSGRRSPGRRSPSEEATS